MGVLGWGRDDGLERVAETTGNSCGCRDQWVLIKNKKKKRSDVPVKPSIQIPVWDDTGLYLQYPTIPLLLNR